MAIALMAMVICAILLSACGSGSDLGRMLYNGVAQACDNKEPDDQSCGF